MGDFNAGGAGLTTPYEVPHRAEEFLEGVVARLSDDEAAVRVARSGSALATSAAGQTESGPFDGGGGGPLSRERRFDLIVLADVLYAPVEAVYNEEGKTAVFLSVEPDGRYAAGR